MHGPPRGHGPSERGAFPRSGYDFFLRRNTRTGVLTMGTSCLDLGRSATVAAPRAAGALHIGAIDLGLRA